MPAGFRFPAHRNISRGMKLTSEQAAALGEKIGPMLNYLGRLREWMTKVGFPMADPLYQTVRKAEVALQGLTTELHYLSCASGVGKPPDPT
jgi:hypothetical protein